MKTWTETNPKAKVMARSRASLVKAAREAFLSSGYGESSVNRIAQEAGVSIKTLYRHFGSKDELFGAVIAGLCVYPADLSVDLPWSEQPPEVAFVTMGLEYLDLTLAPDELALYRVIIRDNARFPQLSEQYRTEVLIPREKVVAAYLDRWAPRRGWCISEPSRAVNTFFALLQRDLLEPMLLGNPRPTVASVRRQVERAASDMLTLIKHSAFADEEGLTEIPNEPRGVSEVKTGARMF